MKTKKILLSTVMGLGVATVLATAAVAAPVRVKDAAGGDGNFASAGLHTGVVISVSGGSYYSQDAGAFGFEKATDSPAFANFTSFVTYCFEIGQQLNLPTTYESQSLTLALQNTIPASANAAQAAERIKRLWFERFTISVDEANGNFDGVATADTKERAAAFQIAIWELAVDNGDGLGVGNFKVQNGALGTVQGDVYALAQKYLDIAKNALNNNLANLEGLYHPTAQNLIIPGGGPGGATVPAPASLALFGAGLVALAAMRRRSRD